MSLNRSCSNILWESTKNGSLNLCWQHSSFESFEIWYESACQIIWKQFYVYISTQTECQSGETIENRFVMWYKGKMGAKKPCYCVVVKIIVIGETWLRNEKTTKRKLKLYLADFNMKIKLFHKCICSSTLYISNLSIMCVIASTDLISTLLFILVVNIAHNTL